MHDGQREFLMSFFIHPNADAESILGKMAASLIDYGFCVVPAPYCIQTGGVWNFVEKRTPTGHVDCYYLTFDITAFKTSLYFQECLNANLAAAMVDKNNASHRLDILKAFTNPRQL